MKLINITLPEELQVKIVRIAQKRYTSTGEFVRSSIAGLLSKCGIFPQAAKITLLRKLTLERMKKQHKIFNHEQELKGLREIRKGLSHARSS